MALGQSLCESFMMAVISSDRCNTLLEHIPPVQRSRIICRQCEPELNARAYYDCSTKNVNLCSNYLQSKESLEEALCHEIVHSYDVQIKRPRANFSNCGDLACSEIRAAFWGECRNITDIDRRKRCVFKVATIATENNFPGLGRAVVSNKFDECFRDQRPWIDGDPSSDTAA